MKKGYRTVDITNPEAGRTVLRSTYWLCKDGDPKQALFFEYSPQYNKDKNVPENLKEYTERESGWKVEVVFMDICYISNREL